MKKILLLSTGGTFNKIYDPIHGKLDVNPHSTSLHRLLEHWQADYPIRSILGKDSLEMDDQDRHTLLEVIRNAQEETIIVIHGTDTMDQSATVVAEAGLPKRIIFTGAMIPWSIDPVEATANLASAIGYAQALEINGVYVAMSGQLGTHLEVIKDREAGRFVQVR